MEPGQMTYLPTSKPCFVCGEENKAGLKTRFYIDGGVVKAKLKPKPKTQIKGRVSKPDWGLDCEPHAPIGIADATTIS